jgi:transketolase
VLSEASASPEVIIIGTGSEISIALEAQATLEAAGTPTRVVSMPCVEWFDEQTPEYKESVLPAAVRARVSVEAGISQCWHRFLGDHGEAISLEHFGASGDYQRLYQEFGITPEAVVAAAKRSLSSLRQIGK